MRNLNPYLNHLLKDLDSLEIGYFLSSSEFERLCIKINITEEWWELYNQITAWKPLSASDFSYFYKMETLEVMLDNYSRTTKNMFEKTIFEILFCFINWLQKPTDFAEVFADLEVINFDAELLAKLRTLHAEKQASLASQAEQQVSIQTAVLPTTVKEETIQERILSAIQKQNYVFAFEELENLDLTDGNFMSQLSELKNRFITGTQTTDALFVQRLELLAKDILKRNFPKV